MTVLAPPCRDDEVLLATLAETGSRVAVCIPARNEGATVGAVVASAARLREVGIVDEIVVVDDHSTDDTKDRASAAGANVVAGSGGHGKGQALRRAIDATTSDVLAFLDADVTNMDQRFITALVRPLLHDPALQLIKPTYRRPLHGRPDEGGRVTALLARPLLRRFFPDLEHKVQQPLAGETAVRRSALAGITLDDGYGIEIGLLLDVCRRHGPTAIAEVDSGERGHRNRPLAELRTCADEVLAAVIARLDPITLRGGPS